MLLYITTCGIALESSITTDTAVSSLSGELIRK